MELEQPLDGQRRVVASVEDRELGFAVVDDRWAGRVASSLARHAASDSANVWIVTTVAYDVAALALLR